MNAMTENCKFYKKNIKRCIALRKTYCEKEKCSFYKPKEKVMERENL